MRFLFVVNRMAHVRHFDRAVLLLAERGHDIVLASQDDDIDLRGVLVGQARIVPVAAPRSRTDEWASHAAVLRRGRDYIRYLHPRYAAAHHLRRRAFEKLVAAVSDRSHEMGPDWSELLLRLTKPEQRRIDGLLARLDAALPIDPRIHAFISGHRPDAVVLSPLVGLGYSQADFVKSARQLGIPTGMLVFSWDNLSNKGLMHELPDRVIVWNDIQRVEAVKLHKCPPDRIVIAGAPRFDAFFEMRPGTSRDEFCAMAGLDLQRPIVTYLCSSKFVAAHEQAFVRRWVEELRRADDPVLRTCAVIVRPHPAGGKDWHAPDVRDVRWPGILREKASISRPFDDPQIVVMNSPMQNADLVLYDTVFHSAAVVGLNTSAEIEAAIVGRPVYTIVDPDAGGQQGTLHFHYLLRAHGGPVELAADFDQHRSQLSAGLAGQYDRAAIASFVQRFVRPSGLDVPVSPIVAHAVESLPSLRAATGAGEAASPFAFNA